MYRHKHPTGPLLAFGLTLVLVSGLLGPQTLVVRAQSTAAGAITVPRIEGEIDLDGHVQEEAWERARQLPLTRHAPRYGGDPSERTEVFVGYTDEYLYAACRCYDRGDPSGPSFKRDFVSTDTDYFVLELDTFNDDENALFFATTPTGLRLDLSVFNDATGNIGNPQDWPIDPSWNSFWNVDVRETDRGWFAEMRIPVSSLRFQRQGDEVRMGLIAQRFIARKNETATFPAIPPDWGFFSTWKPSQARTAVFEDLEPEPPLRVTPYVLGGLGQQPALNRSGEAYVRKNDPTYDAGLDVKYGLTSNLTLDLTLNTDFAQVEADNQQVNLTRFPLFFPEKRRFFQERSSNFAFNFGGSNRLFYSRRIGRYQGHQVRILGGARVVGRVGAWDIGALNMQTARESGIGPNQEALPSENFGVYRLQREVLNAHSNVGGILTTRVGRDGTYNVGYGIDGVFRVIGDQYVTAKWAQTFDDAFGPSVGPIDRARSQLLWERRSYEGPSYELRYARAGRRYEPGLGFELRENYTRFGDRIGYGWVPGEASRLQQHQLNLEGEAYYRNADGSLESLELGPEWALETNGGQSFAVEVSRRIENLDRSFRLSPSIAVPADRYTFYQGELSYGTPSGRTLSADLELTGGSFYDGSRASFQLRPVWNLSRYLRMTGFYQVNRISFPDRDEPFDSHVGRFRVEVTPSVEFSTLAFLQYNSVRDVVVGNVRFRYNPRQGTDLYLVYNDRLNTDRSASGSGPRLPLSAQRTVLLKYTYTFNL